MKLLYSFLGCMFAASIAFYGVNEFVFDNAFDFWPAVIGGLTFGFIPALVLGVFEPKSILGSSLMSAGTLGGLFFTLGALAMFSSNYAGAPFGFAATVEAMTVVGLFGGIGFHLGGKGAN